MTTKQQNLKRIFNLRMYMEDRKPLYTPGECLEMLLKERRDFSRKLSLLTEK